MVLALGLRVGFREGKTEGQISRVRRFWHLLQARAARSDCGVKSRDYEHVRHVWRGNLPRGFDSQIFFLIFCVIFQSFKKI
jgi:hypothetical protein